jgi:hypothetical protein
MAEVIIVVMLIIVGVAAGHVYGKIRDGRKEAEKSYKENKNG